MSPSQWLRNVRFHTKFRLLLGAQVVPLMLSDYRRASA